MSTPNVTTPPNPDRITKPVLVRALVLAAVGLLAAFGIDLNVSEQQAGAVADVLITVVPVVAGLAGLVWGTQRAKQDVTPIRTDLGDHPRAADGTLLQPAGHGPDQGYPRDLQEQAEQLQRRPRVDRRGIDREPPPGF